MLRPEEIIVDLFRQIGELRERGERPGRILLSAENYRSLQDYRARLGELDEPAMDYLGRHEIFNLPVYLDDSVAWKVLTDD